MAKNLKRPRDPNQLAKLMVDIATGESENVKPSAPHEAHTHAMEEGSRITSGRWPSWPSWAG